MQKQENHKVFSVENASFGSLAMEIFRFQSQHNPVYKSYLGVIGADNRLVTTIRDIPFLPIRFFKSHKVISGEFDPAVIFESSGTTGTINSRHLVKDIGIYEESFTKGFERFYGQVKNTCIIGLLPSYLEREHSSLVYMVNELIRQSGHKDSGFYLHDHDKLATVLQRLEKEGQPTLLVGVTFALLDFAERFPLPLKNTIVMETGGMKGRRREMIRQEVHDILKTAFSLPVIHSEYGMTELLSQAYSAGDGLFQCPPWMRVLLRDEEDPLALKPPESPQAGIINVIDLANIHSCSFIATDDVGRMYSDGRFEVLGRMDNSDLRGCSLMVV